MHTVDWLWFQEESLSLQLETDIWINPSCLSSFEHPSIIYTGFSSEGHWAGELEPIPADIGPEAGFHPGQFPRSITGPTSWPRSDLVLISDRCNHHPSHVAFAFTQRKKKVAAGSERGHGDEGPLTPSGNLGFIHRFYVLQTHHMSSAEPVQKINRH